MILSSANTVENSQQWYIAKFGVILLRNFWLIYIKNMNSLSLKI